MFNGLPLSAADIQSQIKNPISGMNAISSHDLSLGITDATTGTTFYAGDTTSQAFMNGANAKSGTTSVTTAQINQ
jgi:hypothetical protein